MARAPKYTIRRNWGWMTNIVVRKKTRTRAPKPAFAILRGLGRPSLLAASALGTVLLVSPAVVNKAHAVDLNVSSDLPYGALLPSGTTVNVNNGLDCTTSNDTCIDIAVYNTGGELNVLFSGGEHDFGVFDSGDGIYVEAWDDDIDITITNTNDASDIYVENGSGIVVIADGNDRLGDVEVTWDGDIDAGAYGVYVENVGNYFTGNTGSVTINVNNVTTDIDGDDGIHVGNVWGGPVDINVAGDINTEAAYADGVEVHEVAGDVFVEVMGSTNTDGYDADGVYIKNVYSIGQTDGNVTVQMGDITTDGDYSNGIDIGNVAGWVSVTTGDITTGNVYSMNEDANGVNIYNVAQGVTVSTGNITTFGNDSDGIDIDDVDGTVTANVAGDIATKGSGADGVDIDGVDGSVNVYIDGDVTTSGNSASGINIDGERDYSVYVPPSGNVGGYFDYYSVTITDSVTVEVGDITTNGDGSEGVNIEDIVGAVTITTGDVTTGSFATAAISDDSEGFDIDDVGGAVTIKSGNITTWGDGSEGINIEDVAGGVYANVGMVTTHGSSAEGVDISDVYDDVTVITRDVMTNGDNSEAFDIDGIDGSVTILAGDINTGDVGNVNVDSDGVDIFDVEGSVSVTMGNISTWGNEADGVTINQVAGPVTVNTGDIFTKGDEAQGVNVENAGDDVDIDTKSITTDGDEARGIEIVGNIGGGIEIDVVGDISTNGSYSDGIGIEGNVFGDVDITVTGNITTFGENADGGFIDPVFGDVTVVINGDINTAGLDSDGWYVQGVYANGGAAGDVSVTINGDITTNGEDGDGIEIIDVEGGVTVVTGDIQTTGNLGTAVNDNAQGVIIGNVGGAVSVTTGNIATLGDYSDGILVYDVDSDALIDINVNGGITTNGNLADGVEVTEVIVDQVDITVTGDIVTNDDASHGVFVHEVYADNPDDGILINVNNVNTSGDVSDGVNISGNIIADMTVNVSGNILVTGDMSAGVRIGNFDGDLNNKDALYGGVYGDAVVNVGEDASVYSAADGILVNGAIVAVTAGSIEINNDGNIGAAPGGEIEDFGQFTVTLFAIDDGIAVEDGPGFSGKEDITLNNEEGGTFEGNMLAVVIPDFTNGPNTVPLMGGVEINNDGVFDAEGFSFLGGKDVQINNDGIFQVTGEYNEYTVIQAEEFYGKDAEFYNTDTVTLSDDDPTDTLLLEGKDDTDFNWRGGPGSTLVVDTFLAGPDDSESDVLLIDGDTGGQTEIVVNDVDPSSPGAYNPEGILVVGVSGYSEIGDFVLADGPINKGLFQYDLYLTDDGDDYEWVLASIPGQAAQEAPSLITGIEELGHQAMAMGVDRLGVLGDCAVTYRPGVNPTADAPGCDDMGGSVWMSVLGRGTNVDGDTTFGLFGQATEFDVSYDQVMWGLMAGADGGKSWIDGNGSLSSVFGGVLGGYLSTSMSFDSGNEGNYDGGMAGIYGGVQSGAWFLNGVLTGMFGSLSFDSSSLDPWGGADESNVLQVGGVVDTGFRIGADRGMSGIYFEPGVTLSVLSTSIDEAAWAGNEVTFEDSTSLRGRAGAKLGMETEGGFTAFIEASLWNEFGDDPEISISSLNAPDVSVIDDGLGMWADVGLGMGFVSQHWSIGAKGDVAYGEDMIGYGGSIKMQVSW